MSKTKELLGTNISPLLLPFALHVPLLIPTKSSPLPSSYHHVISSRTTPGSRTNCPRKPAMAQPCCCASRREPEWHADGQVPAKLREANPTYKDIESAGALETSILVKTLGASTPNNEPFAKGLERWCRQIQTRRTVFEECGWTCSGRGLRQPTPSSYRLPCSCCVLQRQGRPYPR